MPKQEIKLPEAVFQPVHDESIEERNIEVIEEKVAEIIESEEKEIIVET